MSYVTEGSLLPQSAAKTLGFSVFKKAKPPFMRRRETTVVLMITFALAVILFSFEEPEEDNKGAPFTLTEMAYPDLRQLPQELSLQSLEQFADRVTEYEATPARILRNHWS